MPEDVSRVITSFHCIILLMLPAAMTQLSLRQTSPSAVWDIGDGVGVVDGDVVVEVVVVVVVVVVAVVVVVVVGVVVVVVCSTVVEVVGIVVAGVGLPLSTK